MVALSWSPSVTAGTDKNTRTLATPPVKKDGEESSEKAESKQAQKERMIFAEQKTAYAKAMPIATASHKPVAEAVGANAVSYTPIFNIGKDAENISTMVSAFNPSGVATASGLKDPEKNSGSNDKKDNQKAFLTAHKSLEDVRFEALENDDILGSIMKNMA